MSLVETAKFPTSLVVDTDLYNQKDIVPSVGAITINEDLDASETGIDVAAGHGARCPTTPFTFSIDDEMMICTSRSTDALTVVRGQFGTTGATHSNGTTLNCFVNAIHHNRLASEVEALEKFLLDPNHCWFNETFIGGLVDTTAANVGDLGWARAGGSALTAATDGTLPGGRIMTAASSGVITRLIAGFSSIGAFNAKKWRLIFRFKSTQATQSTIRIGLAFTTSTDPPGNGIYLENVSGASAVGWTGETNNAGAISNTSAGAVLDTSEHYGEITSDGAGNIEFFLDGTSLGVLTTNLPTASLIPFFQFINNSSGSRSMRAYKYRLLGWI